MIAGETRERFIVDFIAQLGGAQVIEAHLFGPRRVNGVESGVAVIAADAAALPEAPPDVADLTSSAAGSPEGEPPVVEVPDADSPYAPEHVSPERHTVYTATYRHTLKGPDRGKWEVVLKAEADAPLVTVDQVVRGVQRRAEDTDDVERMSGAEVAAVLAAHAGAHDTAAGSGSPA
ncbi:MAG TPA: hypothetical protein VFK16_07825 [Gemmatimonadaceae bacterium]|nr:hypothetical protein [Gemmatimonadaceae bacterium]